jgi:hypothetical protein
MSDCHYWWRAGEVQWCDMLGETCRCGGWDECCDIKIVDNQNKKTRLVAKAHAIQMESDD